jgi:hypothetical protein
MATNSCLIHLLLFSFPLFYKYLFVFGWHVMVPELCCVMIMESGSRVDAFGKEKKKTSSPLNIVASGFRLSSWCLVCGFLFVFLHNLTTTSILILIMSTFLVAQVQILFCKTIFKKMAQTFTLRYNCVWYHQLQCLIASCHASESSGSWLSFDRLYLPCDKKAGYWFSLVIKL